MAKTLLGIDIGTESLKLMLISGTQIKKTAIAPMPRNLVQNGAITSKETLAELIRTTMKTHDIRCRQAAVSMSSRAIFVRRVTMPLMNEAQLLYNLPYEFRDYITGELEQYVFDYAMITTPEALAQQEQNVQANPDAEQRYTMDLLAVAVSAELMESLRETIRMAGMKLVKAAPVVNSLLPLIDRLNSIQQPAVKEYAVLDLGSSSVRLYMFRETEYMTSRVIETGLSALEEMIAEAYHVDTHLAHTYLLNNHENCQYHEACMELYQQIAVEVMRVLNFYLFSNRDSELHDVWVYGGGAAIVPLMEALRGQLDAVLHSAAELYGQTIADEENAAFVQAYGITQD